MEEIISEYMEQNKKEVGKTKSNNIFPYLLLGIPTIGKMPGIEINDTIVQEKYDERKKAIEEQLNGKKCEEFLLLLKQAYDMVSTTKKREEYEKQYNRDKEERSLSSLKEKEDGKQLKTVETNKYTRAADLRKDENYVEYDVIYEDEKIVLFGIERIDFLNGIMIKDFIEKYTIAVKKSKEVGFDTYDFYSKIDREEINNNEGYRDVIIDATTQAIVEERHYIGQITQSEDGYYIETRDGGEIDAIRQIKEQEKIEETMGDKRKGKRKIMSKVTWKAGTFIYPLPAVMVSCGTMEESNIITVAWTGIINTNPAMVYISVRPNRYSYDLIKKQGEFVINLTNQELVRATDWCGVKTGAKVDKFKEMNLHKEKANFVSCPMIKESPVSVECRVVEVKELGSHHMFVAEVIAINAEDKYINEKGAFDISKCNLIAYSNGHYYSLGKKIGKFGFSVEKKKKKQAQRNTKKEGSFQAPKRKLEKPNKRNKK